MNCIHNDYMFLTMREDEGVLVTEVYSGRVIHMIGKETDYHRSCFSYSYVGLRCQQFTPH